MDLCEFKAALDYMRSNKYKRDTELTPLFPVLVITCLNPSTRKVEAGVLNSSQSEDRITPLV